MQDVDTLFIEFQKILHKVKKYRKLMTNIRNQTKNKVKQIKREQREELLEQERKKESSKEFFIKFNEQQGCQYYFKHEHVHLAACDLIIYKDYKN